MYGFISGMDHKNYMSMPSAATKNKISQQLWEQNTKPVIWNPETESWKLNRNTVSVKKGSKWLIWKYTTTTTNNKKNTNKKINKQIKEKGEDKDNNFPGHRRLLYD